MGLPNGYFAGFVTSVEDEAVWGTSVVVSLGLGLAFLEVDP